MLGPSPSIHIQSEALLSQNVSDHRGSPPDVPLFMMDPEFQKKGCCKSTGGGDLHHSYTCCRTCMCCLTSQEDVLPQAFAANLWHNLSCICSVNCITAQTVGFHLLSAGCTYFASWPPAHALHQIVLPTSGTSSANCRSRHTYRGSDNQPAVHSIH